MHCWQFMPVAPDLHTHPPSATHMFDTEFSSEQLHSARGKWRPVAGATNSKYIPKLTPVLTSLMMFVSQDM